MQVAGSARRMADSVKDIDLIAVTTKPTTLAKSLARLPEIERVSSAGKPGARGRTHSGVSVDLRIAGHAQLGNLLQHFTGSGPHNAALREAAVRKGMHVSEYGVLDGRREAPADLYLGGAVVRVARTSTTSSPSCARTAASWRRREAASCPG